MGEEKEVQSGKKMAELVIDMAKKHEKIVDEDADKSVKTAHKWMKGLLEGKGHDPMWGAKLFAPRTKIMSDTAYKKYQAGLKKAKLAKAKKKKATKTALIEAHKKEEHADKKAFPKKKQARAKKDKKVMAAMAK